jgi:hypothetical protein
MRARGSAQHGRLLYLPRSQSTRRNSGGTGTGLCLRAPRTLGSAVRRRSLCLTVSSAIEFRVHGLCGAQGARDGLCLVLYRAQDQASNGQTLYPRGNNNILTHVSGMNLQSAICNLQSAICNLQSAICSIIISIGIIFIIYRLSVLYPTALSLPSLLRTKQQLSTHPLCLPSRPC